MRNDTLAKPVIVGIDGSQAAIRAAVWAADEAIARDVPLRLLYVSSADSALPGNEYRIGIAELALRVAANAVADLEKPVKVETAVLTGPPSRGFAANVLARESRRAAMLCLGAVGMGRLSGTALGSTASTLTRRAGCPVAIVSKRRSAQPVAVVIDPSDATVAPALAGASATAR
jgi:nucleotide-binding universal stress UspA family protein